MLGFVEGTTRVCDGYVAFLREGDRSPTLALAFALDLRPFQTVVCGVFHRLYACFIAVMNTSESVE